MANSGRMIIVDNGSCKSFSLLYCDKIRMYSIDTCKLGFGGDKKPSVVIKTLVGKEDKPNVGSISNKLHFGADVYKDISKYITLFHLKDLLIVIIFQC
jgi:hypothetical protein